MTATIVVNWIDFLRSRGIYIERGKGIRIVTALIKCLTSETFQGGNEKEPDQEPKDNEGDEEHNDFKNPKNNTTKTDNFSSLSEIGGLSNAYNGRDKFIGKWEENLEESLVLYETLSKLCHLNTNEMSEALLIMLTGDAISYYTMNIYSESTYQQKY